MKKTRLLIFSNIIAPYRIKFFNAICKHADIDIFVVYLAHKETNRSWVIDEDSIEYNYTVLPGVHIKTSRDKTLHINYGVHKVFREFKPDIVLHGTDMLGSSASWLAWMIARIRNIPMIRFEARHEYTINKSYIKNKLFGFFLKRMNKYFVYSKLTKIFLTEEYNINNNDIVLGYNVGDSDLFVNEVELIHISDQYLQERKQLPDVMLLFVGHLDKRKNISLLLKACANLNARSDEVGIFIAGDGPLKSLVLDAAKNYTNIKIIFLGYLQSIKLAKYYALSDIFVLPTLYDSASISVTEALHSGLFVVGSERDGSAANFIKNGMNGFIVDPTNITEVQNALMEAIRFVGSCPAESRKMRIKSSISKYTINTYADRLVNLVRDMA